MKVKLKPGLSTIGNALFELRSDSYTEIDPKYFDSSIMITEGEKPKVKAKVEDNDLNGDGVVDSKDVSIAAKVMRNARKKAKTIKKAKKKK